MKRKVKTIDCTPLWIEVLPVLTAAIKGKSKAAQMSAYIELGRMAQAADEFNKSVSKRRK